jgi:signal transduction histidine kinase
VDPKKIKTNPFDFPVYITRVVYFANNTNTEIRNLVWENITLPSGTSKITISLAALTFNTNHKIKFSYKIEGIQNNFTEVEDNNLTLNTLDYGRYKIIFRYRKEDGSYVNDALTLSVYITPRWYQTWWFTTLLFLLASVILYALYRYRIGQIHKQQEIRKSIARDLHDDLGSTLNSVKIFTNLAISGVKQNESLLQIKNNLTEAITGLRDMIWVLDDSLDTAEELVVRLKQFAMPVTTASNMEFIVKTGSGVNSYTLTKEEKRNLFLICKEAINNSIKYSGASKITLDIIPAGKKIQITVTDNGKGFDEVTVKKGYGLKNMQYRANQINYKLGLTSAPEIGTQINLLPA